jgi:hypothetical protein
MDMERRARIVRQVLAIVAGCAVAMPLIAAARDAGRSSGSAQIPDVVITERRPTQYEAYSDVFKFVTAHSSFTRKIHQVARWDAPVCPRVVNMPKAFGDFVVARIKTLAQRVSAPVKADCKPNVMILYTPNPQAALDWIKEHKPDFLGMHFIPDRDMVAAVTRPIQAWYVTATSNGTQSFVDNAYRQTPGGVAGSRLSVGLSSELVHVLIVINSNEIGGHKVGPIADYVAMIALSQAQSPDDCIRLPSILNYLSPGCRADDPPQAMTAEDIAYLKGLYAISPTSLGNLQRSGIITHMNRTLTEPAAAEAPEASDASAQPQ